MDELTPNAMATECSRDAVRRVLAEGGGRVKHADLMDHFKPLFPEERERRAAARDAFKRCVDDVALVKVEDGVKFVCLRKKEKKKKEEEEKKKEEEEEEEEEEREPARVNEVAGEPRDVSPGSASGSDVAQVRAPPGTDPPEARSDSGGVAAEEEEVEVERQHQRPAFKRPAEDVSEEPEFDMGNTRSSDTRKSAGGEACVQEGAADIPRIAVIEASPLPVDADASSFPIPGRQGNLAGGGPGSRLEPADPTSLGERESVPTVGAVAGRQTAGGSQRSVGADQTEGGPGEAVLDPNGLSEGEEGGTPRASRRNFIEHMMNSSPQVRRRMGLRNSVHLAPRQRDSFRSDGDSASLASSNPDEAAFTLHPLEHEWMMCASDGEWDSLRRLLASEPTLIQKRDFVTGFTCLHWAAKQGKPELLALIVNFAKCHAVPVDVDARSSAGYTPLHLATMHNHMEVVKLLVGAYNADVEMRDYSGKKACQYLANGAAVDIRDIIGAYGDSDSENTDSEDMGRWRLSKVLQTNLRPLRLLGHSEGNCADGAECVRPRQKPLRRKSSLSRMKPKLQKIRFRASQIVHSTSFGESDEPGGALESSLRSRPKTYFFG